MNIVLFEILEAENTLDSHDFRYTHIRTVLRLGVGDTFSAGIINGASGNARIQSMDEEGLHFSWEQELSGADARRALPVTLLVAQVRPICMKRILRDAAMMGVTHLIVTGADTAEKSYQGAGLWRDAEYVKYLWDGAMQAAATSFPEFTLVSSIDEALRQLPAGQSCFLLDNKLPSALFSQGGHLDGSAVIAIGPERGWSDRERAQFLSHGFSCFSLGARVLRTETACVAALSQIAQRMGLM